jgi:hypothetical protein
MLSRTKKLTMAGMLAMLLVLVMLCLLWPHTLKQCDQGP